MATSSAVSLTFLIIVLFFRNVSSSRNQSYRCVPPYPPDVPPVVRSDIDPLQFALNLEHLECDFFLWGAYGYGLDRVEPWLVQGGPPPIGVRKAKLDNLTQRIIGEFGLQEVGHLRVIKTTVGGFPRPLLDLSASNFAKLIDQALGYRLEPPFDPYRDSLSYMLGSYVIPYVGLNAYVGTNPLLKGYYSKRMLAGLLGVEAGQDAVIREYLYERADQYVRPYKIKVSDFTIKISILRNRLGGCGIKDEGLFVPLEFGAENRTHSNVLSADYNSLSYARTPAEVLSVVYGTGSERVPGGFFPKGGNGRIARAYLDDTYGEKL